MSPVLADGCPHEQWCSRCFRWEGHGPAGGHGFAGIMDFKLGFKFRVTVTVTARFKFLAVSRDGHAGTSLRKRGLGSRMDLDRAPRCGPDGSFHRGSHYSP